MGAFARWCTGNGRAQRPLPADGQHADAAVIAVALAPLRRSHTTAARVAVDADLVAVDADKALDRPWLRRLCALPSGRLRNGDLVQDAACWRPEGDRRAT